MKAGQEFDFVLRKKRSKYLPKKILQHLKIRVNDKYTFNASVWVADTPESNLKPTVNLTLQHNGDKIRFCFADTVELINSVEQLRHFLGGIAVTLHNSHTEAIKEYLSFHEGVKLPPINDYTVYTVIQGESKEGKGIEAVKVDSRTGEILGDI